MPHPISLYPVNIPGHGLELAYRLVGREEFFRPREDLGSSPPWSPRAPLQVGHGRHRRLRVLHRHRRLCVLHRRGHLRLQLLGLAALRCRLLLNERLRRVDGNDVGIGFAR
jgi:hypothetical protein